MITRVLNKRFLPKSTIKLYLETRWIELLLCCVDDCNRISVPVFDPELGPTGIVFAEVALSEVSSLSLFVLLGTFEEVIFRIFFNAFGFRPRFAPTGGFAGASSPLYDFLRLRLVTATGVDDVTVVVGIAASESSLTDRGLAFFIRSTAAASELSKVSEKILMNMFLLSLT